MREYKGTILDVDRNLKMVFITVQIEENGLRQGLIVTGYSGATGIKKVGSRYEILRNGNIIGATSNIEEVVETW